MKAMKIIACSTALCTSALLSGMQQEKHRQKQPTDQQNTTQNTQQTTQNNFFNSFSLNMHTPLPASVQGSLYPYTTQDFYPQPGMSNQSNSHQPLLAQQQQPQAQNKNGPQTSDAFKLERISKEKKKSIQAKSMALQKQENETAKLKIMQDLEKQAYDTLEEYASRSWDKATCQTVNLINSFNAQQYVTEDEMQKYAYEHIGADFFADFFNANDYKKCVPVIFLLLKRYNQVNPQIDASIHLTTRQIESFKQAVAADKFIADVAKLKSNANTQKSYAPDKTIISQNILQAYNELETKINSLLSFRHEPCLTIFTAFLNDQPQQEEKNFTSNHIPSEKLPIEILEKIDRLCWCWDVKHHYFNIDNIFPILKLIETAKRDNIGNEDKLGREALARKTPWYNNIKLSYNYSYDLRQKIISILCAFIKVYNEQRLNKITPTSNQHSSYNMAVHFNLIDLISKEKAFNTEQIAYKEMIYLHRSIYSLQQVIKELVWYDSENPIDTINGLIKKYYPHFIETESSQ